MKIKVGFVKNEEAAAQIAASEKCSVVFSVQNGRQALEQLALAEGGVDVLVTELIMPVMDGYTLLASLADMENAPRVIVLSELQNEIFILNAYEHGAAMFLQKPADVSVLEKHITAPIAFSGIRTGGAQVKAQTQETRNKTLDERLSNIFISVGIPAHIKGYQFLRDSIKLAVDNPPIINSITKSLYPAIARRHDTTSSKVERAIRHAIEVAWSRGKLENINSLFGFKVYSTNEKPTNGEFIALLADKMLLDIAY